LLRRKQGGIKNNNSDSRGVSGWKGGRWWPVLERRTKVVEKIREKEKGGQKGREQTGGQVWVTKG